MTITREELAAAASLGLLQYRQVDPLLVFLLQRDVLSRREALLARGNKQRTSPAGRWLSYLLATLALGLALVTVSLFVLLFVTRAMEPVNLAALPPAPFLSAAYALLALGLTLLLWKRSVGARVRILITLLMATLPIAVLALQQVNY
jgi:hypothetical protein